jgi:hypothetical protein
MSIGILSGKRIDHVLVYKRRFAVSQRVIAKFVERLLIAKHG